MTDEFEDLALLNAAYADDETKRLDARFAKLLNIPAELRAIPQWMFAGADKAPHTLRDGRTVHGSVSKPDDWMTFDAAVAAARVCNGHVGFVFTKGCGFTVLDVDVKNANTHPNEPGRWTPPDVLDSLWSYVQKVSSYTERSRSGWGLHVLVRGDIGLGIHSKFLEIYSQDRFMICTGDRLEQLPATIEDRDEEVKRIADEYRKRTGALKLVDLPPCTIERRTDSDVMDWLRSWSNASQFEHLWAGDIAGYSSQSEADAALLNFLWKATEDREQVFRLFRQSKLGEWDIRRRCPRFKANRNDDYLNRSLAFVVSKMVEEAERVARMQAEISFTYEAAQEARVAEPASVEPVFSFPPGFAGVIAHHMYANSYSPIMEVATVATVALLAGVCGRTYRTHTNVDLSLYQILVARSGIGKDAIHKEIPKWVKVNGVVGADRFLQATDFVSGPALHRQLLATPGFLNLQGEFGRRLKRMANPTDAPEQAFRTVLTNAYSKDYLEGKTYSDTAKNVPGVAYPALSFLGETTPDKFKEALTSDMMEDGLLSRFLVTTYTGDRPPPNKSSGEAALPNDQWGYWCGLLSKAIENNRPLPAPPAVRRVAMQPDALNAIEQFEFHCIARVNGSNDDHERAVWNRAHLKALKVASLLAVADCWWEPVATMAHVEWAIGFVERDVKLFLGQLESGDIGRDDSDREKKVLQLCDKYLALPDDKVPTKVRKLEHLRRAGIIPRQYIQIEASKLAAFRSDKTGEGKRALDTALKSALENHNLMEVPAINLKSEFKFEGRAFRLPV